MNNQVLYFRQLTFICVFTLAGMVGGCSQETAGNPDSQPPQLVSNPAMANTVEPTVFNCVQQEEIWSTFAQRGNVVSKEPLITWNSPEFGTDWTPERRCHAVAQRLTDIVGQNGGRLGGLNLTTGTVNSLPVVCYVKPSQSGCDNSNILFTLNQQNARNPSVVLARMVNFAQGLAVDGTIYEGGVTPQYISLEAVVERSLQNGSRW